MAITISGTDGIVGAGFTVDASGVSVTAGVGTFASIGAGASVAAAGLHGTMPTIDGSALTSLSAANLTGTLPAISAANLTNIPAANITGTLPAISGANLTGITAGITMAQRWVFTSPITFGSSYAIITSNLSARSASIGSAMSESSGVFTFPSTGIYKISFYGTWLDQSAPNDYLGQKIQYSTDSGSNYSDGAVGWVSGETNDYASQTVSMFLDVTNASTHRVRFLAQSQGNGGAFIFGSNSTNDLNYFEFIRLGDT